jgi:DNA-binding transcriptional MocR family regulator
LLDPGDLVLVEELSYPGAVAAFRQAGAKTVPIRLDEHGLKVDDLEHQLTELRRAGVTPKFVYTISNNHSPTATTLAVDRRHTIVELAERFGFLVVQDDAYGEIWFDGEHPGSIRKYDTERVIHLGSFSKTIAPALRLGWLAAPAQISEVLAGHRTDLGTSGLLQATVAQLLEDGSFDARLKEISEFYREKRDALAGALEEHGAGLLDFESPPGGFFLWVSMDQSLAEHLPRYISEERVRFPMGSFFDMRGGSVIGGARLAFCHPPVEQLIEGAARLGRAVRRCAEGIATASSLK